MIPIPPFATMRKLAVYVAAIGTAIPAAVALPDPWNAVVAGVIAGAGAFAHYNIPNAPISSPALAAKHAVTSTDVSPPPLPVDSATALHVTQS